MKGGDLHWIWKPYVGSCPAFPLAYTPPDTLSTKRLTMSTACTPWRTTTVSQTLNVREHDPHLRQYTSLTFDPALLNVIETLFNIYYLYLAHITITPIAPLVGFASATMTLSKTVLYWAQEYYCGGCSIGHNNLVDLTVYWIIPNGQVII